MPEPTNNTYDVVIVGSGFAGMYMLHKSRQMGFTAHVFERASDVGGTWYWNRYPGARCDVPSMEYSYQFDGDLQQEWEWTEKYSGQPEILRYASHVADRFDLRRDITFETSVTSAVYQESTDRWTVSTDEGATVTAQFLVMATGCLSSENTPSFAGMDNFEGPIYHTGKWPHEGVDFTGKRVAVIGTGSSGIQAIPIIADEAQHTTIFQRTANYSIPARNEPLEPEVQAEIKSNYAEFRAANSLQNGGFGSRIRRGEIAALEADEEERYLEFERRWDEGGCGFLSAYTDHLLSQESNDTAAEFVRRKIAGIVVDPNTAALLSPTQVLGCKRLCLDTGYFETFNRPNIDLVDVSEHPVSMTASGVASNGREVDVDCIVLATGFDAMTGTLLRIDIRGRDGLTIQDKWSAGPRTYLGLQIPGFPNLFTISGPGSPSVLTNMIVSIEQHVDWIADCMDHLRSNNRTTIEATVEAEDEWVDHVNTVADFTLFPSCNSWYLGANVPGKTRVFMPLIGYPPYVEKCNEVVANGYEGFVLT